MNEEMTIAEYLNRKGKEFCSMEVYSNKYSSDVVKYAIKNLNHYTKYSLTPSQRRKYKTKLSYLKNMLEKAIVKITTREADRDCIHCANIAVLENILKEIRK